MNKIRIVNKIIIKIKVIFYTIIKIITKKELIIDGTGTILTPGDEGRNCRGNGTHYNWRNKVIECCCDECDYMMCCIKENNMLK